MNGQILRRIEEDYEESVLDEIDRIKLKITEGTIKEGEVISTSNGGKVSVTPDGAFYLSPKLLDRLERAEEKMKRREGVPAEIVFAEMREKYGY